MTLAIILQMFIVTTSVTLLLILYQIYLFVSTPFLYFFLVGGLSEGGGSVLQDPRGWVFFSFIKVYIIIAAVYHDLVCTNVCNIF
nr:MAG TPA: hypothetical protein [Caudoviricetes sp.]